MVESGCRCVGFFFSSRRRHTRCLSDWSSDVCSSDLTNATTCIKQGIVLGLLLAGMGCAGPVHDSLLDAGRGVGVVDAPVPPIVTIDVQIGRASCRERV